MCKIPTFRFYVNNFGSIISNESRIFFQPQKKDYKCKITFKTKDNNFSEFYACSYTWLKSKDSYLICSFEKSKIISLENSIRAVSFNFSKVIKENDNHKEAIDNLNTKLSVRDISEISFLHTEVEILITAKT